MGFRYDLHLHSCASSDCETSFEALVTMARRRRLAGIAVTDHDTLDGVRKLSEMWPHSELDLIWGCERTLADGSHLIGLFLREPPAGTTPREVVSAIRRQGGLVYLPHPCRVYSGLLGMGSTFSEEDKSWTLSNCDIIEVYNSKCSVEENRQALELLRKYPKAHAASSDAHYAHEIGIACTEFDERLSPTAFKTISTYAPPAAAAERMAKLRRGQEPAPRRELRTILAQLGLLSAAKSLRNRIRCYSSPKLERYP